MPPAKGSPQDPPDDSTLKRLERELYAKEEGEELVMRRKELSSLGRHLQNAPPTKEATTAFANVAAIQGKRRRRLLIIGGAVALLVVLFVGAVFATLRFRASRQVTAEQIGIEVKAPADVTAGDEVTYTVAFENNSRTLWNSVDVVLEVPEGFRVTGTTPQAEGTGRELVWRVGSVARAEHKEVQATGRLIGEESEVAVAQAEITLSPENFPSGRFSKTALASTRIVALPIDLVVDAATTAGSGERIRGVIRVRNAGANSLTNAVLQLAAPPGLEFSLEDPEFSPGFDGLKGEWNLEEIPSLGEITKVVVFTLSGQPGERRMLEVQVGVREPIDPSTSSGQAAQGEGEVFVQRTVSHAIAISASELTIEQFYNGSDEPQAVFPEAAVKGVARFANVGSVGMRNVIVTIQFEGTGLDVSQLRLPKGGAFDPVANTISWSSATIPQLAVVQPGQSGELEFEFAILPATQFPAGPDDKNFSLVSTATIDSDDLPTPVGQAKKVISDRAVLSIGTQLSLSATAVYDDGRLGITSAGPVPPRAGETTTYTVKLRFGSLLNDVGDARVIAVLPDGVGYTGKTFTTTGSVEFNERSREVIWQIPLLQGLTGRARPAEELHFQVSITPGANLVGKVIAFLNRLMAEGQDTLIEQLVTVEVKEFPTTETASRGKGQVEP